MSLPPGPSTPALLQRVRYLRDPLGVIDACAKQYGDVFRLNLSKQGWVFLCNPADVRELYAEGSDTFAAGEAKRSVFGKLLGSSSSLLLDGPAHRRRRKLLVPKFRGDNMRAQSDLLRELCATAVEQWVRRGRIRLHDELHELVRRAIVHSIFGQHESRELFAAIGTFADKAVGSKLLMFPSLQVDLGPWSPWGRIERIIKNVDREVYAEIARRRSAPPQDDLLGSLLEATGEDGQALSDTEVRDEILTLVVAGHESTTAVLSWLFYAIVSRPQVLANGRRELADRLRPGEWRVDELVYLDAVMREALRFYSTIPNGSARIARVPTKIHGFDIPAGALVTVAMHRLHRRPEIFMDPDRFVPDRFLTAKPAPYQFAPFGGGDRRCLGMAIAIHEVKTIVATVLSHVDLRCSLSTVRPIRRGAFLAPQDGLPVEVSSLEASISRDGVGAVVV